MMWRVAGTGAVGVAVSGVGAQNGGAAAEIARAADPERDLADDGHTSVDFEARSPRRQPS
jgi:hypothetical protein